MKVVPVARLVSLPGYFEEDESPLDEPVEFS
jgi:hypothetical protein